MTLRFLAPWKITGSGSHEFRPPISLLTQQEDSFSDRWTCSFCWAFIQNTVGVYAFDLTPCLQAFHFVYIDVLVERGVTWTTEKELTRRIKVGRGGNSFSLPPIIAGKWKCCGEMLLVPQISSERLSHSWGHASSHVEAGLKLLLRWQQLLIRNAFLHFIVNQCWL